VIDYYVRNAAFSVPIRRSQSGFFLDSRQTVQDLTLPSRIAVLGEDQGSIMIRWRRPN
jgi:hypothetical protein